MSQPVGFQYFSRIPSLSDDASIVEAFKVYHYGVDDWTTQPIPDDSIEGNFRTLNDAVDTINSTLDTLPGTYVEQVSSSATPNVITAQTTTTVPITIRAITSQTSALQQWQNSASTVVGSVSTGGFSNFAGYVTVGSTTQASTVGVQVNVINAAHTGIVVKAQTSQTGNLQEWQNSSGTPVSWVDKDGRIYYNGDEIYGSTASFFLMGA